MAKIREEITKWQNSVSMLQAEVLSLTEKLEAAQQSGSPEVAAMASRLEAAEARQEAAETRLAAAEAKQTQAFPQSGDEGAPVSPPSSAPNETPPERQEEAPPPPPQTRAARKGWI